MSAQKVQIDNTNNSGIKPGLKGISIELLKTCTSDNRAAHYQLYKILFACMYNVCSRYHNNDEDIKSSVNMVFLKVITNLQSYLDKEKEVSAFEYWVRRVAINYVIDEFRKNKKYREAIFHADDLSYYDSPETNESSFDVDMDEVMSAIEMLPKVGRTIFKLYAVDGYKHKEIADMMHISENTSKAHYHKAKIKLRELLTNTNISVMLLSLIIELNV